MTGPKRCYPDTIFAAVRPANFETRFSRQGFQRQKLRRRTSGAEVFSQIGHCPLPSPLARCADYKVPDTVNRVEESNKDLLSCSVQCRTRTKLLRGYAERKS